MPAEPKHRLVSNGFRLDADGVLRFAPWDSIPWLIHGFETRNASGHLPSLPLATLRQVHSAIVHTVLRPESGVCAEGDALVTRCPGVALAIRTADCIPLLIVDSQRKAVAAVHAGWRGVVAGVVPAAVQRLTSDAGCHPEDLQVAIGPCIREDAFEVGPEVAIEFASTFPERLDLDRKTHLDLAEAAIRQMEQAGVPRAQIADCGWCTYQDRQLHSFRRDREESGRMHAFIGITE